MKQHDELIKILIERANSVLLSVRLQNSGADVHDIGNIRNSAGMFISLLEEDPESITEAEAREVLGHIEQRLVTFYQQKYLSR